MNEFNLIMHRAANHENKNPIECDKCIFTCQTRVQLNLHIVALHCDISDPRRVEKEYKCDQCTFDAMNEFSLKMHKAANHENISDPRGAEKSEEHRTFPNDRWKTVRCRFYK